MHKQLRNWSDRIADDAKWAILWLNINKEIELDHIDWKLLIRGLCENIPSLYKHNFKHTFTTTGLCEKHTFTYLQHCFSYTSGFLWQSSAFCLSWVLFACGAQNFEPANLDPRHIEALIRMRVATRNHLRRVWNISQHQAIKACKNVFLFCCLGV